MLLIDALGEGVIEKGKVVCPGGSGIRRTGESLRRT